MTLFPRREPHATLTRHFFHGFFRFRCLDDAGEESMKRAMLGVLVAIFGAAFLMSRLYAEKYKWLRHEPSGQMYGLMLPADQMEMIALPMLLVAIVMALVSHAIFPDELDFRILVPLPLRRRAIFESKAFAVALFAAIFIVAANVVVGVPFGIYSQHIDGPPWPRNIAVQLAAGMLGSVFAAVAVVAVQGAIVLTVPKRWLARTLMWTQTAMICALVLVLPAAFRIPHLWDALRDEPRWMFAIPPAWFLGIERMMFGGASAYYGSLAVIAVTSVVVAAAVAVGSYLLLYRRFDRVSIDGGSSRSREVSARSLSSVGNRHGLRDVLGRWRSTRAPAYVAVYRFTSMTISRSGLHHLVVFASLAAGIALGTSSVLSNIHMPDRWIAPAALGAPLTAIVISVLGMRTALLLPATLKAAWVFRMTEREDTRARQLDAVRDALWMRGVVIPVAATGILPLALLGVRTTLAGLPIVLAIGWILVEIVTGTWRRVPFTCTVLFGKRPAAQTVVIVLAMFFVVGSLGTALAQAAVSSPGQWFRAMAVLTVIGAIAHWRRRQTWGRFPLEFEDYLPDGLDTLKL